MCLEEGARWVLENEQGQASGCHLVVPPRQNGWVKWRRNKVKDIILVSNAYCSLYLRWVTWNKARKLIFAVSNPKSLWMKKHHLNNYWTGEYISFFFSVPFTPVSLLLHLQYYRIWELYFKIMFQNVGAKKVCLVTTKL